MGDVKTDAPRSPRPGRPRRPRKRSWLIRGGLLSIHLAMLGADLTFLGIWQPFPGPDRAGATASSPTRSTRAVPALAIRHPRRPLESSTRLGRPTPTGSSHRGILAQALVAGE